MGAMCYVVRQDLERGSDVIPGMAPVVALASFAVGGLWDTIERRYVGESQRPRIWYSSEAAAEVIQHPDSMPDGLLIEAGMGAGKTVGFLARWTVAQALRLAPFAGRRGIEGGVTSPTDPRLEEVIAAIRDSMRPDWYDYDSHRHLFRLHNGVRIRCLGTARRSKAQGSRVQGWNWAFHGADEHQDNCEERAHMDARGRRAPGGRYKQLATSTPKISTEWRACKTQMMASGEWGRVQVRARSNPFVLQSYWDAMRRKLSPKAYLRMVEGQDIGPERATYPTWDRERNLRQMPMIGCEDVTERVLRRYDYGLTILCGHDPGVRYDVTLVLTAHQMAGEVDPVWWVRQEITTDRTTTEQHLSTLVPLLRDKWGVHRLDRKGKQVADGYRARIHVDPYSDSSNRTHRSVYQHFAAAGLLAISAAQKAGRGSGRVPVDAGIEMICRLFCDAAGRTRLIVECDANGEPVAPKLVDAIEMSERDIMERAETEKKGSDSDRSHWPAALRYALWPLERLPESMASAREILA